MFDRLPALAAGGSSKKYSQFMIFITFKTLDKTCSKKSKKTPGFY